MIEAHALTKRYGDTTAVSTGDHAGAGGVARSLTLGFGATIFGAGLPMPPALLVGAAWAINLRSRRAADPQAAPPDAAPVLTAMTGRITPGGGGSRLRSSGWRDTDTGQRLRDDHAPRERRTTTLRSRGIARDGSTSPRPGARSAPPSSRSRPDEAHAGREQPDAQPGGEP